MTAFLDLLGAVKAQVEKKAVKDIPVPPGDTFVVRFRPPADRDKLTPVVAAYRVGGALSSDQELQLLVDCCDQIMVRDEKGQLVEQEGGPLKFDPSDERWGDDVKTARQCVAKLYNLDKQPLAASGTADAIVDWLQGIDAEIETRVEGNSSAAAS